MVAMERRRLAARLGGQAGHRGRKVNEIALLSAQVASKKRESTRRYVGIRRPQALTQPRVHPRLAPGSMRRQDVTGDVVPGWAHERSPTGSHEPASGPPAAAADFDVFVAHVRQQVEARLVSWLDVRVAEARDRGDAIAVVADGIRQLTMRGGKRLRPVLLAAAYVAC